MTCYSTVGSFRDLGNPRTFRGHVQYVFIGSSCSTYCRGAWVTCKITGAYAREHCITVCRLYSIHVQYFIVVFWVALVIKLSQHHHLPVNYSTVTCFYSCNRYHVCVFHSFYPSHGRDLEHQINEISS